MSFTPSSVISAIWIGLVIVWAVGALTAKSTVRRQSARLTLGRNWSGTITVNRDHELMTAGPYAIVRHPIYSGLLLTLAGTAYEHYRSRVKALIPFVLSPVSRSVPQPPC